MIQRAIIFTILTVFTLGGCVFVGLTPEGEKIRLLTLDEVETCRKLGRVSVATVVVVPRPKSVVREELLLLGRNNAVGIGGDTIVAETPDIAGGRQAFSIYKCVDPNG